MRAVGPRGSRPGRLKEFSAGVFFHIVVINRHPGMIFGTVAWTLLYEAWFYLSLPLLAVVFLQKTKIWKKALAIGISAALFVANHLQIAVCCAFLGGIVAVYWVLDEQRVKMAESKTASLVALACVACLGLFIYDPFNPAGIALLSIFFVVISSGNTLFGLLAMPAARWMGEISYSIYLIHGIVIWLVMTNILPRLPGFHLHHLARSHRNCYGADPGFGHQRLVPRNRAAVYRNRAPIFEADDNLGNQAWLGRLVSVGSNGTTA